MKGGDRRLRTLLSIVVFGVGLGVLVSWLPDRSVPIAQPSAARVAEQVAAPPIEEDILPAYKGELHERFQQAAVMLHAGQPDLALVALERVLTLAPDLPEAHVNAGFALFELNRIEQALQHFETALRLRPNQVNAYYGMAIALDGLGDQAGALGAMRTFIHRSPRDAPHVRKARAAIWEWQNIDTNASDLSSRHQVGDQIDSVREGG